jgi:hypothetical protein
MLLGVAYIFLFTTAPAQELVPDILIVNLTEGIGAISVRFERGIASTGIPSFDVLLKKSSQSEDSLRQGVRISISNVVPTRTPSPKLLTLLA